MFWTDAQQAGERLNNCLVVYDKTQIVHIHEINRTSAICSPKLGGRSVELRAIELGDEKWNDFRDLPPLGFINTVKGVFWLKRTPRQTMRHGLNTENCEVFSFHGGKFSSQGRGGINVKLLIGHHSADWHRSLLGEFPTYKQCLEVLPVGSALAISSKFMMHHVGSGYYTIYRNRTPVGYILRDQPFLTKGKEFLKEELEKVFKIDNFIEE